MTTAFARAIEGIPVVASTAERDQLFPNPARDQRVQLRATGELQRFDGTSWFSDLNALGQLTFSVKTYGATEDGSSNDAPFIQSAINAAQATRGRVVFTQGKTYRVTSQLSVTGSVDIDLNGAILLCDLTGPVLSAINAGDSTSAFRIHGGGLKWYGSFGTSLAGGVYVQGYSAAVVEQLTLNGLGAAAISNGFNTNFAIRSIRVVEHGPADMISLGRSGGGLDPAYGVTIDDCFLQFTQYWPSSPTVAWQLHECISGSFRHLTIRDVACESARRGLWLGTAIGYEYTVANVFFENCVEDIRIGQDFGTGFYSLNLNGRITGCASSTSTGTFCRIEGVVEGLEIDNNSMDCAIGINVVNHRNTGLRIGINRGTTPTPLTGYPSLTSSIQYNLDVQCVAPMNDASQWSKSFDPTATGALSSVAGLDSGRAVQLVVTGDQCVALSTIASIDLTAAAYFSLMLWIDDPAKLLYAADLSGATWTLLTLGTDAANYFSFPMQLYASGKAPILRAGWNEIKLKKSDAVTVLAPNWNNITRVQVTNFPTVAQTTTMKFGGLYAAAIVEGGIIERGSPLAFAQTTRLGAARWTTGRATSALPTAAPVSSRIFHEQPAPGVIDEWVKVVGGTFVPKMLPGMIANIGNNGYVIVVGVSPQTLRWGSAITSTLGVTLPVAGLYNGLRYLCVRTAAATGASPIDVGGLYSLATPGSYVLIEYDGSAWYVVQAGTLVRAAALVDLGAMTTTQTAGAAYTATEQAMLAALKADMASVYTKLNTLLQNLRTAGLQS